jgi:hypothetical protein
MILTYRQGSLFSACVAGGLICYQVPKAVAAAAIVAAVEGISLAQANEMLDNAATPESWNSTWKAAVSADLENLSGEVATLSDRERADRLAAKIETALAMLADVQLQFEESNRLTAEANQLERERIAAAAAEAKRQSQQQAAVKQRQLAEADKARDLKAGRLSDGSVEVTEAHFTQIGGSVKKVRRLVARYAAGSSLPPEVEAMLR